MGFFEDLGKKVGEFTHEAKRAADESTSYACENCGERFHTKHETCPNCESQAIVALEKSPTCSPEASATDSPEESTETAEPRRD